MKRFFIISIAILTAQTASAGLTAEDLKLKFNSSPKEALQKKVDIQQKAIDKNLQKINRAISALEKEISKNNRNLKELRQSIVQLEKQQKVLEEQLTKEIDSFNHTSINILKLSSTPNEMLVLQDALRNQQKRTGVLSIYKKQLEMQAQTSSSSLESLKENLKIQKENQDKIGKLNTAIAKKKEEFNLLRRQQSSILKLPLETRLKMKNNALQLGNQLNINKFLANNSKTKKPTIKTAMANINLPIKGDISAKFHSKDRITEVPIQGIIIEGDSKGKIKTMHDGRVIYSGVFREYGHLVILEHQTGAHSLYAGFGKALVDVGDYVNSGELMGFLPNEEGARLYYEVRINNKAQNPQAWLSKDLNKA